jgi:hypothetical protein
MVLTKPIYLSLDTNTFKRMILEKSSSGRACRFEKTENTIATLQTLMKVIKPYNKIRTIATKS